MRTKSINDILAQVERIRSGYGWKARKDRYNYEQYISICNRLNDISSRYIRNIGRYQREKEGMTRNYQEREWNTVAKMRYGVNVYTKNR